MSTSSGGSFATLLMTVPLAAIPLMAVFGVPKFSSVSASGEPSSEDIRRHPPSVFASRDGQFDDPSALPASGGDTGFVFPESPQTRPSMGGAPRPHTQPRLIQSFPAVQPPDWGQRPAAASPGPHPTALATSAADPFPSGSAPAHESSRAPRPQAPPVQPPSATEHLQGFSWQQAARQLQQWGIEDYHLERGHQSGSFLFVCQFAIDGDSRIVRRFEAENSEPLLAVQRVFDRIDEWRQVGRSSTGQLR